LVSIDSMAHWNLHNFAVEYSEHRITAHCLSKAHGSVNFVPYGTNRGLGVLMQKQARRTRLKASTLIYTIQPAPRTRAQTASISHALTLTYVVAIPTST
jgi:hypothetical protein